MDNSTFENLDSGVPNPIWQRLLFLYLLGCTALGQACVDNQGHNNTDAGSECDCALDGDKGSAADTDREVVAHIDTEGDTDGDLNVDHTLSFEPSNVDVEAPLDPLRDVRFKGDSCEHYAEINTDTCSVTCIEDVHCTIATQSDGLEIAVIFANAFEIENNVQVSIKGQRALVIVAFDRVDIFGTLFAFDNISTHSGFTGGFSSTSKSGPHNGSGLGGGLASFGNGGAGGGGFCGRGGNGGVGDEGSLPEGQGGGAYGNPEIIPLQGGSAGGKRNYGSGGAGGGAVQIISKKAILVGAVGAIHMPGNGGEANSGGGGGAGGAILLEAPEVTIDGVLAVNGGGGGSGCLNGDGMPGQPGRDPAFGGACQWDSNGGNGSAGDVIDGYEGMPLGESPAYSGGGGGGGAGWIRINTASGESHLNGFLSPSLDTNCASIGTLTI